MGLSCLMVASEISEANFEQFKKIQKMENWLKQKNEALLVANDKLIQMEQEIINVGNAGWTPIKFSFNIEIERLTALTKGTQQKLKVIEKQDQAIITAKAQDVQEIIKYATVKKDLKASA